VEFCAESEARPALVLIDEIQRMLHAFGRNSPPDRRPHHSPLTTHHSPLATRHSPLVPAPPHALRPPSTPSAIPGFPPSPCSSSAWESGPTAPCSALVNALLLRPLLASHPERLVGLYTRQIEPAGGYRAFSYPNYADLRDGNDVFADLAAYTLSMTGLREGGVTRRTFTGVVSANYLRTFGLRPVLGRDFQPEEERPGSGASVVIVSHPWWQRSGGDRGILGTSVTLNGHPFTVIGVAPEGFTGTTALFSPDMWVPLGAADLVANDFTERRGRRLDDRGNHLLMVFGRLKPDLAPAAAAARLDPLARRLAEAHPAENKGRTWR
jgi:hypothetical protein